MYYSEFAAGKETERNKRNPNLHFLTASESEFKLQVFAGFCNYSGNGVKKYIFPKAVKR